MKEKMKWWCFLICLVWICDWVWNEWWCEGIWEFDDEWRMSLVWLDFLSDDDLWELGNISFFIFIFFFCYNFYFLKISITRVKKKLLFY
jgi:hypothetical protein